MSVERHTPEEGEWIEWAGGDCPVPGDTLVEIKLRNGNINGEREASFWIGARCWWSHQGRDRGTDIIAYRVVPHD